MRRAWVRVAPAAAYLLTYLIIPNALFASFAQFNSGLRALVNIDYLALGAVAPWLHSVVCVALYIALLVLDAAAAMSNVYHFQRFELLRAVPQVFSLNPVVLGPLAVTLLLAAGLAVRAVRRLERDPPARVAQAAVLGGAAVLFAALDLVGGSNRFAITGTALWPVNVATSGAFTVLPGALSAALGRGSLWDSPPKPVPAATDFLRAALTAGGSSAAPLPPRVALVIVESLGLLARADANAALQAPLLRNDVRTRYDVTTGSVGFGGSTTKAELRELCGVQADYRMVERDWTTCLPWLLRRAGYRTTAVHGFTRKFFERARWYPRVGFETLVFEEDSEFAGTGRRCGAVFRGICDNAAAGVARKELLGATPNERRFVYWLTLTSHLPIERSNADVSGFDCAADADAQRDADVCAFKRVLYRAEEAIARVALDPDLPPTLWIVVGDHAPPFVAKRKRALFVGNRVPFLILRPRREAPRD